MSLAVPLSFQPDKSPHHAFVRDMRQAESASASARILQGTSLPQFTTVADFAVLLSQDDAVPGRLPSPCGRIDGAAAIAYPPAIPADEATRKSGASLPVNVGLARRADRAGIQAAGDRRDQVISRHAAGVCFIAASFRRNGSLIEIVVDEPPCVLSGDAAGDDHEGP